MPRNTILFIHFVLLAALITDVRLDDPIIFDDDFGTPGKIPTNLATTEKEEEIEAPIVDIPEETEFKIDVRSVVRLNKACEDPTFAPGTCQPLKFCPPLLQIALRPQLKIENMLLKSSYCGTSGVSGLQLFCCRDSFFKNIPNSRPLPSPTRRTTTKPIQTLPSRAPSRKCESSSELNSRYCGVTPRIFERVVGGKEAPVGAWPWAVLLSDDIEKGSFFCGGALITNRHVLTAAHCVHSKNEKRLVVRLAEHNIQSTRDGKTIDIKVQRMIIHEDYSTLNQENDIAVLSLSEGVCFKDRIMPVCLADRSWRSRDLTNLPLFAVGWGKTNFEARQASTILNEVILKSFAKRTCADAYKQVRGLPKNFDNIICAGDIKGGKDTCQGDSGGPLVLQDEIGKFHLVGVVSAGLGCGMIGFPGLYTRVSSYYDWIKEKLDS